METHFQKIPRALPLREENKLAEIEFRTTAFEPNTGEVGERREKLDSDKRYSRNCMQRVIRAFKLRMMRWKN